MGGLIQMQPLQECRKPIQFAIAGRIAETAAPIDGVVIEKIKRRGKLARQEASEFGGMFKIIFPSGSFVVAFGYEILLG